MMANYAKSINTINLADKAQTGRKLLPLTSSLFHFSSFVMLNLQTVY